MRLDVQPLKGRPLASLRLYLMRRRCKYEASLAPTKANPTSSNVNGIITIKHRP